MARDGSVRGLWCYEAGQAGFGDMLAWFVRTFPRGAGLEESFRHRIVLTSGLARRNRLLVRTMAGAVAAGLVAEYAEGGDRFGARTRERHEPRPGHAAVYERLYAGYRRLAAERAIHQTMRELSRIGR